MAGQVFQHTGKKRGVLLAMKARLDRNRLGELLVIGGMISRQDLHLVLAEQRTSHKPLGRLLVERQKIRRHQLYCVLAQQWGLRLMTAAMTAAIMIAAFSIKPARAESMANDLPAQVRLVNVANAAFSPVGQYPALFGSEEKKSTNIKPFTKWSEMFINFERDANTDQGAIAIQSMLAELKPLQGQSLRVMAQNVDRMMNRVRYVEDRRNWGRSDYWANPIEFMARGGDCEDYAIAKYTALRVLGVPEERLRVAIVQDMEKNIAHAVLIVYADEGAMILDNQSTVTKFADSVRHYRPIFSINRQGWWLHSQPRNTLLASATAQ